LTEDLDSTGRKIDSTLKLPARLANVELTEFQKLEHFLGALKQLTSYPTVHIGQYLRSNNLDSITYYEKLIVLSAGVAISQLKETYYIWVGGSGYFEEKGELPVSDYPRRREIVELAAQENIKAITHLIEQQLAGILVVRENQPSYDQKYLATVRLGVTDLFDLYQFFRSE
jgi:hypothetical protein